VRPQRKEVGKMAIKEFCTCPDCGRAISGEKKEFFVCPKCGRALCRRKDLKKFDDADL